ncbi:uncharacterized protein [Narcine bancroftii]|uniref:uncharacterized protein isoform X2 n=1 Tax=Narcine bancroftii TaxID=1343680 RepID=UPI003830FF3F
MVGNSIRILTNLLVAVLPKCRRGLVSLVHLGASDWNVQTCISQYPLMSTRREWALRKLVPKRGCCTAAMVNIQANQRFPERRSMEWMPKVRILEQFTARSSRPILLQRASWGGGLMLYCAPVSSKKHWPESESWYVGGIIDSWPGHFSGMCRGNGNIGHWSPTVDDNNSTAHWWGILLGRSDDQLDGQSVFLVAGDYWRGVITWSIEAQVSLFAARSTSAWAATFLGSSKSSSAMSSLSRNICWNSRQEVWPLQRASMLLMRADGVLSPKPLICNRQAVRLSYESPRVWVSSSLMITYIPCSGGCWRKSIIWAAVSWSSVLTM